MHDISHGVMFSAFDVRCGVEVALLHALCAPACVC